MKNFLRTSLAYSILLFLLLTTPIFANNFGDISSLLLISNPSDSDGNLYSKKPEYFSTPLIYEQTMNGIFHGAIASLRAEIGFNYFSADNFTLNSNAYVKSLKWEGIYHPNYPKDNEEKGFNLIIFDNAPADDNTSWIHPGNIVYSNYFDGYAGETLESTSGGISLYSYQVDLPEELLLFGRQTYWFSVQFSTSSSVWMVNMTTDPVIPPVALQTTADILDGSVGSWSTNKLVKDMGFEIHGNYPAENVYLIPEQNSKTGYVKQNITYDLEVCNCSALTNSFNLNYNSNKWNVTGQSSLSLIPPYGKTNITVSVLIPENATHNQLETSVVVAVCADYPALSNSAMLSTKCQWYMTNSVNIFTNNFNNWPPDDWTMYELADPAGWTNYSPGADGTGGCAMHSDNNVSNICDDWLVSPAYDLSNLTNYLKLVFAFDNRIVDKLFYGYSGIMISTGNENPASNDFTELLEVGNNDTEWTGREVDLDEYATSTNVYFAFRYTGDWSHKWYVDNPAIVGKTGASTLGIDYATILPDAIITNYCCSTSQVASFVSIYVDGETGSDGPASNLVVEIGSGPVGTSALDKEWRWLPATYYGESVDGSNDIFSATFESKTYDDSIDYAFRARNGGDANLYIDSNGTADGYSSNYNGKVMFIPVNPVGSSVYNQTMDGGFHGVVKSGKNNFGNFNFSADNFYLSSNTFLNTVQWEGFYDPYHQRDGNEKGFNLIIFDNASPDNINHWNHPGNIIYSNFFQGYACEKKMSYNFSLGYVYRYQIVLPEKLFLAGNKSYWMGVQLVSSSSTWNVTLTLDPVNNPVALTTTDNIMNGLSATWKTNNWARDMAFELYGDLAPDSEMSVHPSQIDFGQVEVDSIVKTNISVENIGTVPLEVNASLTNCSNYGLMALNWDSANIGTGDIDYLELTIDTTGFDDNIYTCQLLIASTDPNNSTVTVPVSIEVIPEPFYLLFIIYYLIFINRKFITTVQNKTAF